MLHSLWKIYLMGHTLQSSLIASSSFILTHLFNFHCCFIHLANHLQSIYHQFTHTFLYPKLAYFHLYLYFLFLNLLHFINRLYSQIAHFYWAHHLLLLFKKNFAMILPSRSFCLFHFTRYDFLNEYSLIF